MKFASLLALALPLMAALGATSCIEDAVTTNPSDQPLFSTDTLALGELFTADPTPTHRFTVYNRHDRILTLSRVALSEGARGIFRLNVDGQAGAEVMGVDIRPNDSVLVFVEATLPPNAQQGLPRDVEGAVEFTVNGRQSRVVLTATGRDAATWRAVTLQQDTRLSPGQPYHIYDSLVVAPGATLTLEAGGELYFHSGASLVVRGRLLAQGTPQAPVVMAGDRFGQVATNIPYEIMSGQWGGVAFAPTSRGNRLEGTVIKNTEWGVLVQGDSANVSPDPVLTLVNCQLRNSKGHVLQAAGGAGIRAIGCELADASLGPVSLYGGSHVFNHCTIANYYLFTAITEPALQMWHVNEEATLSAQPSSLPFLTADISNTILYGLGSELMIDGTNAGGVIFRRCLFGSPGQDDEQFLDCLYESDPLYLTDREAYLFDYRLQPESPALGAADPSLTLPEAAATDRLGNPRPSPAAIGAYEAAPAQ